MQLSICQLYLSKVFGEIQPQEVRGKHREVGVRIEQKMLVSECQRGTCRAKWNYNLGGQKGGLKDFQTMGRRRVIKSILKKISVE